MKKNYWPLGIFAFLGVMVCSIILSVYIALKNPAQEDDTYFSSKKEIDSNINQIIKDQNRFSKEYQLYLGINKFPQVNGYAKLFPPYLAQAKSQTQQTLYLDATKDNHLYVKALCKEPQDLSISLYMEKINAKQEKIELGEMHYENGYFASNSFSNLQKGRYKAIFEVSYQEDGKKKKIFFEREVFAI